LEGLAKNVAGHGNLEMVSCSSAIILEAPSPKEYATSTRVVEHSSDLRRLGTWNRVALPRMTLVLLPGMHGTGDLFEQFKSLAQRNYTIVIVRYPTAKALGREEYLELVNEALPRTADYLLVGESFSGSFAMEIASRNPPRHLVGLVLVSTFASSPIPRFVLPLARALGPGLMRAPAPRCLVRHFLMERNSRNEEVENVIETLRGVKGKVLSTRLKMILKGDVSSQLAAIKTPSLILGAERDRLVRKSNTEQLAAGISNAKMVWIDGPHLLLQTRAAECLTAINQFAGEILQ
jgi:pimeloyl-[acyl-carrier protein] methyl ester esterase